MVCKLCYDTVSNENSAFGITETKFYVPVVTLSTQGDGKLLPQLK